MSLDDEFMKLRAECHEILKNKEESIIKKWLSEIGYAGPVGYYRNISDREMEIYTTRPGILIGKHGTSVDKFRTMLNEEFGGKWKVKFVEIRGGFVMNLN